MTKINIYNQEGKLLKELDAPKPFFSTPFNSDLIQQALTRQLANRRLGMIAHAKTKGEVVGGKKKPFRQKGTGHARQGASNNPHQKGGGVAFGPRNVKNYKQDMPKKQRRLALFSALTVKLEEDKVLALDKYETKEPKTKEFARTLASLPIDKDVLIVLAEKDTLITKSAGNLPNVKTILVNYLNIADLQKYDKVLFLENALNKLTTVFLSSK